MGGNKRFERLSPDKEELACAMVAAGEKISLISETLGFAGIRSFTKYRAKFPDFEREFQSAIVSSCEYLEEKLMNVHTEYADPKRAEIASKNYQWIMKARNRQRYGDSVQMDVAVQVDVSGVLERAERRVLQAREVIESNVLPMIATRTVAETENGD